MSTEPPRMKPAEPLTMYEIVFPSDLNPVGSMFGGKVVALMDICATLCARRWCNLPLVTASIDAIQFLAPIRQGQMVQLTARIVYVGKTSCVIKVAVGAEDLNTGHAFHCCQGYFNMVAIDSNCRPIPLNMTIAVETDGERHEWELAHEIKEAMLARRKRQSAAGA